MAYLIRLDDACPTMDRGKWLRMESILDKYGCRPIVGIIPASLDKEFDYPEDPAFWTETAKRYQDKGWLVAQHGCHHLYHKHNGLDTEFMGLSCDEQKDLLRKGYEIMLGHGIARGLFLRRRTHMMP